VTLEVYASMKVLGNCFFGYVPLEITATSTPEEKAVAATAQFGTIYMGPGFRVNQGEIIPAVLDDLLSLHYSPIPCPTLKSPYFPVWSFPAPELDDVEYVQYTFTFDVVRRSTEPFVPEPVGVNSFVRIVSANGCVADSELVSADESFDLRKLALSCVIPVPLTDCDDVFVDDDENEYVLEGGGISPTSDAVVRNTVPHDTICVYKYTNDRCHKVNRYVETSGIEASIGHWYAQAQMAMHGNGSFISALLSRRFDVEEEVIGRIIMDMLLRAPRRDVNQTSEAGISVMENLVGAKRRSFFPLLTWLSFRHSVYGDILDFLWECREHPFIKLLNYFGRLWNVKAISGWSRLEVCEMFSRGEGVGRELYDEFRSYVCHAVSFWDRPHYNFVDILFNGQPQGRCFVHHFGGSKPAASIALQELERFVSIPIARSVFQPLLLRHLTVTSDCKASFGLERTRNHRWLTLVSYDQSAHATLFEHPIELTGLQTPEAQFTMPLSYVHYEHLHVRLPRQSTVGFSQFEEEGTGTWRTMTLSVRWGYPHIYAGLRGNEAASKVWEIVMCLSSMYPRDIVDCFLVANNIKFMVGSSAQLPWLGQFDYIPSQISVDAGKLEVVNEMPTMKVTPIEFGRGGAKSIAFADGMGRPARNEDRMKAAFYRKLHL